MNIYIRKLLLCVVLMARIFTYGEIAKMKSCILPDYHDNHIYFDRIVGICLEYQNFYKEKKIYYILAVGVLIDDSRVLTSLNPFRLLIRDNTDVLDKISVTMLKERRYDDKFTVLYYQNIMNPVKNGRPVIPYHEVWHGDKQDYSPQHDLLVLRIDKVELRKMDKFEDMGETTKLGGGFQIYTGPSKVDIAKETDIIDTNHIAVANPHLTSYRPNDDDTIRPNLWMEVKHYYIDDDLLIDCEELLPTGWGHFICAKYQRRWKELFSGTLLFSDSKLFGIGCFSYWFNGQHIAVFTDVRKYYDLIMKTATDDDLNG